MIELAPGETAGWLRAFFFTEAVEVPIYVLALGLLPRRQDGRLGLAGRVGLAFLLSLVTHPVVWFVFPRLIDIYDHYESMVVAAETFAVAAEALMLYSWGRLPARSAALLSLATNMASMSLGFLSRYFFPGL